MSQIDRLLGIAASARSGKRLPVGQRADFATIAPYTLEETYEVLDAIAREDFDDLRGELGDLLFRWFYAQMAQEEGALILTISAPRSATSWNAAIRIFSAMRPPGTAARCWPLGADQKRRASGEVTALALDDIPRSLPALMRAHKIQKRCSAVG